MYFKEHFSLGKIVSKSCNSLMCGSNLKGKITKHHYFEFGHFWYVLDMFHQFVMTNPQNDCAPGEDSDQPRLIRAFAVHSMGSWGPKVSSCGQWRLWSDWADAQADLSLRWEHRPFCWLCHKAAQIWRNNQSAILVINYINMHEHEHPSWDYEFQINSPYFRRITRTIHVNCRGKIIHISPHISCNLMVGKQTLWYLSFLYLSQICLTIWTVPKFGKHLGPFG